MAAFFASHGRWKDMVLTGFLAVMTVHCLLEAAVTLVRTRWYFRVASELANAVVMAGMGWLVVSYDNGWPHLTAMLGLVVIMIAWGRYSVQIEQRKYPNQLLAFNGAAASAGRWGWLLFRHVPRISEGALQ
jgi:hypothetical protein